MALLKYTKLSENAFDPVKGSENAAGFDLKSAYDYVIKPHSRELVHTDLQFAIPLGCYGRIAPRSGLSLRQSVDIAGGVIDMDYRGNVGVIIVNNNIMDLVIKRGDRIVQLICEKIEYPSLKEEKLDETSRGKKGFGSSGLN